LVQSVRIGLTVWPSRDADTPQFVACGDESGAYLIFKEPLTHDSWEPAGNNLRLHVVVYILYGKVQYFYRDYISSVFRGLARIHGQPHGPPGQAGQVG
jgi:hypothetical protein